MAAPKFSVGVDADPMMVEQTIDKTLEEIIKERRKEVKGELVVATPYVGRDGKQMPGEA